MAEKIVIIGNGFDLRHFLPTKYNHLITILREIESLDFNTISEVNFENLFGKLFKEKDEWFYEKIKEFYETAEINFDIEELKSIQERIKTNNWFQYLKSVDDNKIDTWIDFETEIDRVLKNIGDYFDKFNNDGYPQLKKQRFGRDGYSINNDFADNFFQNRLQRNILIFFNLFILQHRSSYTKLNLDKVLIIEHSIQYFKEKDFFDSIYKSLEDFIGIFNDYLNFIVNQFYDAFKEDKLENFIKKENRFLFDGVKQIYSFNYTETFQKLYKLNPEEVNFRNAIKQNLSNFSFVHGKAIENWEKHNERNELEYDNLKMVLGVSEIDVPLKSHKLFQFTKYFQKLHKDTEYLFLDKISSINDDTGKSFVFYFWGHSLDASDKDYINDVFSIMGIQTQSEIKIFYHSISGKADQLKNLLGIIDKNTIEKFMKKGRLIFMKSTPENLFKELA